MFKDKYLKYKQKYLNLKNKIGGSVNFELDENNKIKLDDKCKFSFKNYFEAGHEIGECSVAIQVIKNVNNVIEIGGGAGKVSHMINTLLGEKLNTQHIVVEAGFNGTGHYPGLEESKKHFSDKYTIIKKFANELVRDDFKMFTEKPDCLYVDCEGCLYEFQNTEIGKYILSSVRYIVNEMDGYKDEIRKQWKDAGFEKIGEGYGCGTSCNTEVWFNAKH
jgi:hypothetical protein